MSAIRTSPSCKGEDRHRHASMSKSDSGLRSRSGRTASLPLRSLFLQFFCIFLFLRGSDSDFLLRFFGVVGLAHDYLLAWKSHIACRDTLSRRGCGQGLASGDHYPGRNEFAGRSDRNGRDLAVHDVLAELHGIIKCPLLGRRLAVREDRPVSHCRRRRGWNGVDPDNRAESSGSGRMRVAERREQALGIGTKFVTSVIDGGNGDDRLLIGLRFVRECPGRRRALEWIGPASLRSPLSISKRISACQGKFEIRTRISTRGTQRQLRHARCRRVRMLRTGDSSTPSPVPCVDALARTDDDRRNVGHGDRDGADIELSLRRSGPVREDPPPSAAPVRRNRRDRQNQRPAFRRL